MTVAITSPFGWLDYVPWLSARGATPVTCHSSLCLTLEKRENLLGGEFTHGALRRGNNPHQQQSRCTERLSRSARGVPRP
jgi:hypothetical protein